METLNAPPVGDDVDPTSTSTSTSTTVASGDTTVDIEAVGEDTVTAVVAAVGEDADFDILPVEGYKAEIVEAIRATPYLICIGETGSGKTTKIPQYCLDCGLVAEQKAVCITQPRRVAAITVANRVASERGGHVGQEVGYSVRFDDKTSRSTRIKYLTDGILVRELLWDPTLSAYSIVILDEAHERSIHTDILFALTKAAVKQRNGELKVIITSATLDVQKFRSYFDDCPVLAVPGRVFAVDIFHSKNKQIMTAQGPVSTGYVQGAVEVALQIHNNRESEDGHILIFLTGSEEIEDACSRLRSAATEIMVGSTRTQLLVLPLYASLPPEAQRRAFMKLETKPGFYVRKCVVATNIAETSVTVPHVRYVIDSGYVKQKTFDPTRRIESLTIVPVSQVSAQQRAGRAGRTCGYLVTLYLKMVEKGVNV
jgi:ATP-dependent RNA helicase DHX8/PRP22